MERAAYAQGAVAGMASGAMCTGTNMTQPKRDAPQVERALSAARNSFSELEGVTQALIERLGPVLQPSHPAGCEQDFTNKVPEMRVPLAGEIDNLAARARGVFAQLDGIISRLEI